MNSLTQTELLQVVTFCKENGINEILFRRGISNEYCSDTKTIRINLNHPIKLQTYVLCHEYGHHRIIETPELRKKFEKLLDREAKNTLTEQILALEEEMLAWHFGEELAREMHIDVTDKVCQIFKSKCLKSHIVSYNKIVPEE